MTVAPGSHTGGTEPAKHHRMAGLLRHLAIPIVLFWVAAAEGAIKGTSLAGAKLLWAGASSNYRDVQDFSRNDLAIMMLATFGLVFIIVLIITRALVGSIIVLITMMLSFAGALGLAGSGNVAVVAAIVLAGTMLALLSCDVVNIGQAGSTICIGLIFDMMVVRLFLVMPLARLLGAWFWWPTPINR